VAKVQAYVVTDQPIVALLELDYRKLARQLVRLFATALQLGRTNAATDPADESVTIARPRVAGRVRVPARRLLRRELPSADADGKTILLVDDNAQIRELAQRVLERQGYTLLPAQDGLEAWQLASVHGGPIHLLLTDLVMPGVDGKTLADQLAQARPDLRILYMSGYADGLIGHHGTLEAGVAFLQKPFTPISLLHKVRAVLEE
jgi:CheY-like chemotaxis protein